MVASLASRRCSRVDQMPSATPPTHSTGSFDVVSAYTGTATTAVARKGCPHKLSEMELMEGALMSGRFVLAAFSALQPGAAHFGDEPLEAFFAIPQGKRTHFFAI